MGALNFPALDSAIANFENVNPLYNNPGAIQAGSFANKYGAIGSFGSPSNPIAIFPSSQQGQAAQDALITQKVNANPSLTIADLINSWTGGQAPLTYAPSVASAVGGTPSTPVASLGSGGTAPMLPASGPSSSTPCSQLPWYAQLGCYIAAPFTGSSSSPGIFNASRIVAIVLGFIFIAAGLYMLKPGIVIGPAPVRIS